jgi:hypothetical protein
MGERLDEESRSILEYRPNIAFIGPEVVSDQPKKTYPVEKDSGLDRLKKLRQFAKNVQVITEETQKQADQLAKGFEVQLDTNTDSACIRAMQRHYPGESPLKVTYEQYKQCKDHQRELMENVPDKILSTLRESEIKKAKKALKEGDVSGFLGFVEKTDNQASEQMIPPADIDAIQNSSLRALANMLWKEFIKPVIPLPPGVNFLPDEIAPMPPGPSPEEMMGQAHNKTGDNK